MEGILSLSRNLDRTTTTSSQKALAATPLPGPFIVREIGHFAEPLMPNFGGLINTPLSPLGARPIAAVPSDS